MWFVFIGIAFAAQLAAPAGRASAEEAFAAAVDEQAMQAAVHDLVGFGPRMGGTPSNERSSAYLADYFRKLGLAVDVTEDPPALAHWEDGWAVRFIDGGRLESAYPMGFSPRTTEASGKLIAIADLRNANAGPEWKGAVLYTPAEVRGASYASIAKSGNVPLAILTSAPNDPARYVDWARLASLPERTDNPFPVFSLSYVDGRTAAAAAAAGRSVVVRLSSTIREGRGKTVIATLPGREPDKYFLVCAHGDSDSGGPGADDNASGVATVMEMARVYAHLIQRGEVPRPRYSVRFAIWGSEYVSAKAYIQREGDRLRDLQAVLNFDETGTGAEREAIYFESNDVPWNTPLLRTFEAVAAAYADRPGFWSEYTTNPSQGGTDSYAFLPRQYKGTGYTSLRIPSTTIYTAAWDELATVTQTPGWESRGVPDPKNLKIDYSLYYHSSGDTPEHTTDREPQNMARAARITGMVLMRLNQ